MKHVQILFSPTGGTRKVAEALTAEWPSVETVDLSAPSRSSASCSFEL